MFCKVCNCELGVSRMRTIAENDDTPDKETKVYIEHEFSCRNKACTEYGKVVETTRIGMELG